MEHKSRGIQPVFANPSRQVVRVMRSAGLPELIGEEFITVRMNDAVLLCQVLPGPAVPLRTLLITLCPSRICRVFFAVRMSDAALVPGAAPRVAQSGLLVVYCAT